MQRARHPGALNEAYEFRTAGKVDVLAVVDDAPIQFEGRRTPAEQPAAFEELDVPARIF
jgi:hypothetical protein